ncbi:MAG TPA: hypothetical protein VET90_03120, partial [Candidatus Binatus sp.]|nr:hypothetical protein [Candidatus Binatus sp.]
TSPSLSTVRLPLRDLGRRGFAFAEGRLAGGDPAPERLATTVVLRDSTGPAPAVPTDLAAVPRPSPSQGASPWP